MMERIYYQLSKMRYEKRHILIVLRWLGVMAVGLLICLLISLASCKTRYITQEVPITIHDSIHVVQTEHITDTVWQQSIISMIDTMWLDTSTVATIGMPILHHDRTTNVSNNNKESTTKATADTMYIYKEKPITVTETETEIEEVEKPLKWWQSALMWLGGILTLLIAVCIGWTFWRIKH